MLAKFLKRRYTDYMKNDLINMNIVGQATEIFSAFGTLTPAQQKEVLTDLEAVRVKIGEMMIKPTKARLPNKSVKRIGVK
jgi:hypothetical protein